MVHSRGDLHKMENVEYQSTFMDSWKTSVSHHTLSTRLIDLFFTAGAGKSVLWCVSSFSVLVTRTYGVVQFHSD